MNYQIGPTPPPSIGPLPSLDQNELEQTLVYTPSQAQAVAQAQAQAQAAATSAIYGQSSPPSAPVQVQQQPSKVVNGATTSLFKQSSINETQSKVVNDIVAITPQSHAANVSNNSASNHSTTSSNHTTATTIIESASHSSGIPSIAGNSKQGPVGSQHGANSNKHTAIPPPQLANPLPTQSATMSRQTQVVADNVVIPMPQSDYNALITQMYGTQPPTITTEAYPTNNAVTSAANQTSTAAIHDELNEICYNNTSALTAPATFNLYGTAYDTNPYGLYNTPPLPSAGGYYAGQPSTSYYGQPASSQTAALSHAHYTTAKTSTIDVPAYTAYHQSAAPSIYDQSQSTVVTQQRSPHRHTTSSSPSQANSSNAGGQTYHYHHHHHHVSPAQGKASNRPNSNRNKADEVSPENLPVQYLHRADGTIISPHTNPITVQPVISSYNHGKSDERDPFTAGDDALFRDNMVTIINVNWQTNIPYATVRIHNSNRIYHVPLMDLTHIDNGLLHKTKTGKIGATSATTATATTAGRYRLGINPLTGKPEVAALQVHGEVIADNLGDIGTTVIRRNPKLSDETLMKLPHLRKHREYIRTIDVNMGPKDYNSYRVSVNSKNNNGSDEDPQDPNPMHAALQQTQLTQHGVHIQQQQQQPMHAPNTPHHRYPHHHAPPAAGYNPLHHMSGGPGSGRTANIQNLSSNAHKQNGHNLGNANNRKKNKRMSACEKGDLFKTELCENWVKKGHCTYGKKCHFAHGRDDIRTRWRIENYKTQPCCDPARADSRLCLFGKRCNYAHPGEPLRRSHHCLYLDEEYQAEILKDYGKTTPYPFGIYI